MIRATQNLLESFLKPTEDQVFEKFLQLRGAQRSKNKGCPEWVFIPGKRSDRVLCVAHADTVHADRIVEDLIWIGDVCCRSGGVGGGGFARSNLHATGPLGADDRAGCAMMYDLFDGSHSLLVTAGEERGLIGARAAVKDIGTQLAQHQFAVQVDRRGDRQAVFYDIGTEAFKAFITSTLTAFDYEKQPWREWDGSSTDIKHICGEIGICGVNLSAGYWNEHSDSEMLLLGAWLHTRTVLRRLLKEPKLAQFKFQKRTYDYTSYQSGVRVYDYGRGWQGGSMYVSDVEDLIKACEMPDLSGKRRKKLAAQIRKFVETQKIQRWQAVRMLDKLYPITLVAEHDKQVELLPAATPMADSYFDRTSDSLCYCGAKEIDPKELHKMWCHKQSPTIRGLGKVRRCVHGLPVSASCHQCKVAQVTTERCPECNNMYVHTHQCRLQDDTGLTEAGKALPGANGGTLLGKPCEQCGASLPNHSPTCLWSDPKLCGYCHRAAGRGHSIMCPHWQREVEMTGSGSGDIFCGECHYNITAMERHADNCSRSPKRLVGTQIVGPVVNKHVTVTVKVKPKSVAGATVHQMIEPVSVTICCHECPECKRTWKHQRLPLNNNRTPRGCLIPYVGECPRHKLAHQEITAWYEVKVLEALGKLPPKPVTQPAPPQQDAVPDPHDVSAQLREMGSWD